MIARRWCVALLLGILGIICDAQSAVLKAVEVRQQAGKTSLFFALSAPVSYRVFTLVNPNRVVVDFENTALLTRVEHLRVDPKIIRAVRSGRPYPGTLRLVFEVTKTVALRTDPEWRGLRLELATHPAVVTRRSSLPADFSPTMISPSTSLQLKTLTKSQKSVAVPHALKQSLRPVIVVLDPGHGGRDPGAHGPHGVQEKHIVLAIAKRLQTLINAQPGMKAVLTRRGDYYLGLRERLRVARRYHADVFVSIHADAFRHADSMGVSIFALSQSGATSEAARWLAEKENYSELGGVNLSDLDDKNGLVRTVLIDLSQTATVGASLHLGEGVLKSLNQVTTLHAHHVEQARFVVLKSPDIPSILIETGFISNPQEERLLSRDLYQIKLSKAIFNGLKHYFWEYPPQGTLIEHLYATS